MTGAVIPACEPWSKEGGPHGVLVLHGFTGCPQSMRPLAEAFAAAGYAVELPLLPGHGTTVEDMLTTTWVDWSAAAETAYHGLTARCDRVVVAGLSMGGSLTVWLATRRPSIAGIVCVNPLVAFPEDMGTALRSLVEAGEETIDAIGDDVADPEIHEVAYDRVPLRPLLSLADATAELRATLGQVTCPTLLLTSPQDHVVPPANSDELAAGVAGPVERVSLDRSYHVATIDHDRDLIAAEAVAFAGRVTTGA
ncbi:MAG: alpha/beta hydrolase [Acidimicrobiales bacterium]